MSASAGFLEMPNTTEAPSLERHSLLLDLDIPAVRDRDPDPQSGPHLNVKEFRIQGLIEYPDIGITREKIIQQVEALRFDMMGEGKKLGSGYTIDELSKVSDLIAEIEENTEGQHVGPLEVQKLVFLIREQRRQRGITLGMIETVADTITRYYRERGFILAKAYIPKQEVRDGVVTLTLLLGELGEVDVKNNKRYSKSTIERIFKDDFGKPITNERIEEKLYLVNDLPGISAQGYFEPGSQVGDSKLNINIAQESWYDANFRIDNHGSERSGKNRAYAQFLLHNPTTFGDELEIAVLGSYAPQNTVFGSFSYSIPVFDPRLKFSLGGSTNDFIIGSGSSGVDSKNTLDISGKSTVFDSAFDYQFKRSRVTNFSTGLKFSQITSEMLLDKADKISNDTVTNVDLSFHYDSLNEKNRVLNQASIDLISSHKVDNLPTNDDTLIQKDASAIIAFDYSRLSFVKLPFIAQETRLLFRASGQYAGSQIVPVNQFSLSGPTKTRGFKQNEFFADDAVFVGGDLIFKGPELDGFKIAGERFDNMFQPFIFMDAGYGISHSFDSGNGNSDQPVDNNINAYLVDAGIGIKINYTEKVHGNLSFAEPIAASNSSFEEGKKPGEGLSMYFDLQVNF